MKIPYIPVYVCYPRIFQRFRLFPYRMTLRRCGRDVYRWLWWNWSVDVFADVFNARRWEDNGGDKGDNSEFWERARIDFIYYSGIGEELASVVFPSRTGLDSKGHFTSAMNRHFGLRKIDRFFLRKTGNLT